MLPPSFPRCSEQYQSMVGSLNWLATNSCPDLTPVTSFLAANSQSSLSHLDSALYIIKYLCSMVDYGIAFHSNATTMTTSFVHFSFHHDVEAYKDTMPPTTTEHDQLTAYSDTSWGSQLGLLFPKGTTIHLLKFWSMSSHGVVCNTPGTYQPVILWSWSLGYRWMYQRCPLNWHQCEDICLRDNIVAPTCLMIIKNVFNGLSPPPQPEWNTSICVKLPFERAITWAIMQFTTLKKREIALTF